MKFKDIAGCAVSEVVRNGHKSFLSVLSIAVSIFSLCAISGLGETVSGEIYDKVSETGIQGITIYPSNPGSKMINYDFADDIFNNTEGIQAATPLNYENGSVDGGKGTEKAAVVGVNQNMHKVFGTKLLYGKYFSENQISGRKRIALISDDLAQILYKRTNILGKNITISVNGTSKEFEVSGIIRSQKKGIESIAQMSLPAIVYIPYTTLNEMTGEECIDKIAVSCFKGFDENKAANEISRRLTAEYGVKYKYENINEYISGLWEIIDIIKLFIQLVAAIALIVGGIGIMNSMFFMVDSRKKDIGIYLALGETRFKIMMKFLVESVLLCTAGGLMGIFILKIIIFATESIVGISFEIPAGVFLKSIAASAGCGIIFGVIPARNAAKLEPSEIMKA